MENQEFGKSSGVQNQFCRKKRKKKKRILMKKMINLNQKT